MQRNLRRLNAATMQAIEERARKVQTRRRCGDRAARLSKNGLIALDVRCRIGAVDIRR
jgi:hypothetical protein